MRTPFQIRFVGSGVTESERFHPTELLPAYYFMLDVAPEDLAKLDLAGRCQQIYLRLYSSPGRPGHVSIDTELLDPLLRVTLQNVLLQLKSRSYEYNITVDVRRAGREWIVLDSLPLEFRSFTDRCLRSGETIYSETICTFQYPEPRAYEVPPLNCSDDLVLVFPWEGRRGSYLYTSMSHLIQNSPYFATLANCKDVDNVLGAIETNSWKRRRSLLEGMVPPYRRNKYGPERSRSYVSPVLQDDSDAELSDVQSRDLPTRHSEPDKYIQSPTRYLLVKHHSYKTYAAVLQYLHTGNIAFGELSSLDGVRRGGKTVSPKSVYRLAHQLQLGKLEFQALDNYKSQLKASYAGLELFDEANALYPELAKVTMEILRAI